MFFILYSLITISDLAFSSNIGKINFPNKIENRCDLTWNKERASFLVGSVSVVVDLKNKDGNEEESALIYIDCKGSPPKRISKAPYIDWSSIKTSCVGVRLNLA